MISLVNEITGSDVKHREKFLRVDTNLGIFFLHTMI